MVRITVYKIARVRNTRKCFWEASARCGQSPTSEDGGQTTHYGQDYVRSSESRMTIAKELEHIETEGGESGETAAETRDEEEAQIRIVLFIAQAVEQDSDEKGATQVHGKSGPREPTTQDLPQPCPKN